MWDADTIDAFVTDLDGQAAAWYTGVTGQPIVLPSTPEATTQQQITALAGGNAAQRYPLATYTAASGFDTLLQPGVILIAAVLLAIVVLRR